MERGSFEEPRHLQMEMYDRHSLDLQLIDSMRAKPAGSSTRHKTPRAFQLELIEPALGAYCSRNAATR